MIPTDSFLLSSLLLRQDREEKDRLEDIGF
jgi:hypothetical protein